MTDVENAVNSDLESLRNWLIANKLSLNVGKTEFMLIGSRQMIKDFHPKTFIENKQTSKVDKCKTLGIIVYQHLSWKNNTKNVCRKITPGICSLCRIKPFVDKETLISACITLLFVHTSIIHCCCEMWNVSGETQTKRLQKLQNRAARVIMNMSNDINSSFALSALGWELLNLMRKRAKPKLMYKTLNKMGPESLKSFYLI